MPPKKGQLGTILFVTYFLGTYSDRNAKNISHDIDFVWHLLNLQLSVVCGDYALTDLAQDDGLRLVSSLFAKESCEG